jgi:hypothetical protein
MKQYFEEAIQSFNDLSLSLEKLHTLEEKLNHRVMTDLDHIAYTTECMKNNMHSIMAYVGGIE